MAVSEPTPSTVYDLLIIGAGPAGLAAGYRAEQAGLSYLILEKGIIAQTVYNYPIGKPLFSTPNEVELAPGTLKPKNEKPTREEVLAYYNQFALREHRMRIHLHESVHQILREADGRFLIVTPKAMYRAHRVLVATGGFGLPRKLGVPGETESRVSYRFVEAFAYGGQDVLVVGGGNSAAEAVLFLHEGGANVSWSLRRPTIGPRSGDKDKIGVKPWVRAPIEQLEAKGEINIIYSSTIAEVLPDEALLKIEGQTELLRVPCSHIFALLGADPDVTLLRTTGAEIASDGRPVYNPETYETTIPGLFVAGHLTREMHMKNAVAVPPRVVEKMLAHSE
ncbi:MAG TPA: NAD(P)-binding domain-containing protein [Acidobacteriota bacterium]|nr:NAD(P)-binding domain-containing protein [Acidobacteriota bacterium]HND22524.1 NAD(P)-binding domain-containing protein [Acidobacteriota bacterium]HNG93559.1 NAD(P)-binding domain-containing protein [Acidobacteriota bacterium]